jgi:hypothetical protein
VKHHHASAIIDRRSMEWFPKYVARAHKLDRLSSRFIIAGLSALIARLGALSVGWFVTVAFGTAAVPSGCGGVVLLAGRHPRRWFLTSVTLAVLAVVAKLTVGWSAPVIAFGAAIGCACRGIAAAGEVARETRSARRGC